MKYLELVFAVSLFINTGCTFLNLFFISMNRMLRILSNASKSLTLYLVIRLRLQINSTRKMF